MQFGEPDRRVNLGAFPQTRSELEWFDVIVLGDVNTRRWTEGLAQAINRLVVEDGKSLVVIAGPNLAQMAETPSLAALLPVELTRQSASPIEGPIDVRMSPEGARSPFFFNPPTAGSKAELPPMDQIYPPLRKKPAATVLLEAVSQANAYGNLIVMAEHTVGRGRVLFIGTDTLWKWQTLGPENDAGVTLYGLFWRQALRALGATQPGTGGASLWLLPDRTRYEAGGRVVLRAEAKAEREMLQPKIVANVIQPDDQQIPLAFAADPAAPGTYRAEFETTMAGQHRITASLSAEGQTLADTATAIDVEEPKSELAGTRVDTANLARIAAATGGRQINLADPGTWPAPDKLENQRVQQTQTFDLWNSYALMLLLCALLGADWLLRLLRGYV
jgi:hypothetical protein